MIKKPRLRVAISTSSSDVVLPEWAGQLAEDLDGSNFAHVVLLVTGAGMDDPPSWAFGLYWRLLGQSTCGLRDPLAQRDCSRFLSDKPRATAARDAIAPHAIDVLIWTSLPEPASELAEATRFGVWRLEPGDDDLLGSRPPLFWEARENRAVSAMSLLLQLPGETKPNVLDKACFSTERDIYAATNRVGPYWGGAALLYEQLEQLGTGGLETIRELRKPVPAVSVPRQAPGALDLISWVLPRVTRKAVRRLRRAPEQVNEWRVAVRRGGDLLRNEPNPDMEGFEFLEAPRGHFYADPFLGIEGGRTWLFVEDYIFRERRGVLACGELTPENRLEDVRLILDKPYHLSYPMVFRCCENWYMMPESNANGTLDLYIADKFPYNWRWLKTLFHGRVVDASIWIEEGGGLVWLFVTFVESRGRGMTLRLYTSESLEGEWRSHPANPISRDVRNARGAGRIFRRNGKLYRPSQDCSWRYGYGFALNEIIDLTEDKYEERVAVSVQPDWSAGLEGTHTYNHVDGVEAVDASWYVPKSKHA